MSHSVTRPLLCALVVLAACAARAPAQVGVGSIRLASVHGQVRYAPGGAPADNVIVRLEAFRGGLVGETQTDRLGKFQFTNLSPDLYIVRVHMPGYIDAEQQVDLKTSVSEYVQLQLALDRTASSGPGPRPPAVLNAGEIPVGGRGKLGRTASYTRFDAHADYALPMGEQRRLKFIADFFNVFNSRKVRLPDQFAQLDFIPGVGNPPNPDFLKPRSSYNPFNMRLGIRFEF